MMEKYYEINVPIVISEPIDDELVVISLVDTASGRGWYYFLLDAKNIPFYEKAAPVCPLEIRSDRHSKYYI